MIPIELLEAVLPLDLLLHIQTSEVYNHYLRLSGERCMANDYLRAEYEYISLLNEVIEDSRFKQHYIN